MNDIKVWYKADILSAIQLLSAH